MAYTGTSVVDYLKSTGQDSSYSARTALASSVGITGYTGTQAQNTALLQKLQGTTKPTAPLTPTGGAGFMLTGTGANALAPAPVNPAKLNLAPPLTGADLAPAFAGNPTANLGSNPPKEILPGMPGGAVLTPPLTGEQLAPAFTENPTAVVGSNPPPGMVAPVPATAPAEAQTPIENPALAPIPTPMKVASPALADSEAHTAGTVGGTGVQNAGGGAGTVASGTGGGTNTSTGNGTAGAGTVSSQAGTNPDGTPNATISLDGSTPLQQGGKFGTQNFGRVGDEVVELMSDGSYRKVSESEFDTIWKTKGLNLDVLPQVSPPDGFGDLPPAGPPSPTVNADGSPKLPGNFIGDYQAIVESLGLTDIKSKYEKIMEEYQELENKKIDEIAEVNDNPWLSEGLRQKRAEAIGNKYESKELVLTEKMKLYDALYKEGMAEAKYLTSGVQEDRNKLLDIAAKKAEAAAKLLEFDPANYKEIRGGLFDVKNQEWIVQPTSTASTASETEAKKVTTAFNAKLAAWDRTGTREALLARLTYLFPQIPPEDIATAVYTYWKDGSYSDVLPKTNEPKPTSWEEARTLIQGYKDNGFTQEQVEDTFKNSDGDKVIPLEIQKALDEIYGND